MTANHVRHVAVAAALGVLAASPAFAIPTYWNVFNIEGESAVGADFVTYSSLADMLTDTNRTGVTTVGSFGRNIVGTGSDGSTYWNLFNIEGESAVGADFVTYSSLADMLTDTNRTGVTTVGGFGRNIVGTGASIDLETGPGPGPVAVPEPAILSLFGAGMLALGFARRRRAA